MEIPDIPPGHPGYTYYETLDYMSRPQTQRHVYRCTLMDKEYRSHYPASASPFFFTFFFSSYNIHSVINWVYEFAMLTSFSLSRYKFII